MLNKNKQSVTKGPSDDKSLYPVIQVGYMTRTGDATVCENYGIHGNPPTGTPCLMFTVNGDESNRYVIPLSALVRTKELKEGEFETGNFVSQATIFFSEDSRILIKSNNDITLDSTISKTTGNMEIATGVDGTFSTGTGTTVTISKGIITDIA